MKTETHQPAKQTHMYYRKKKKKQQQTPGTLYMSTESLGSREKSNKDCKAVEKSR